MLLIRGADYILGWQRPTAKPTRRFPGKKFLRPANPPCRKNPRGTPQEKQREKGLGKRGTENPQIDCKTAAWNQGTARECDRTNRCCRFNHPSNSSNDKTFYKTFVGHRFVIPTGYSSGAQTTGRDGCARRQSQQEVSCFFGVFFKG